METTLRDFAPADLPRCEEILAGLGDWFGLPEANRGYLDGLGVLPTAVAQSEGRVVGFLSLRLHTPRSVEIEIVGVERALHRQGAGRALVTWAVDWCRANAAPWLHVKTRGPSTPDPGYERTRLFYEALGFEPLFESLTLWGEADAALILVRKVEPS